VPRHPRLFVDHLEARETPATLVNASTVTYQDVDGDSVTVRFSKPILTPSLANLVFRFDPAPNGIDGTNAVPQQLREIDLARVGKPAAAGLGITITSDKGPQRESDGFANVGQIQAADTDLGPVTVDGDLGRMTAGDPLRFGPGLRSLSVTSLGRLGTTTGAADLHSVVQGRLGKLVVKADVAGAFVEVLGPLDGKIGTAVIGGSLAGDGTPLSGTLSTERGIGSLEVRGDIAGGSVVCGGGVNSLIVRGSIRGAGEHTGAVSVAGPAGTVRVDGDLVGGDGDFSGLVNLNGRVGVVRVGGNVIGGAGFLAGRVDSADRAGRMEVGGDVIGGAGGTSGSLGSGVFAGSVFVGGSVVGGPGTGSGSILMGGAGGSVTVGADVVGGSSAGADSLERSGFIQVVRIGTLTVHGSLISGTDATTGTFLDNGSIRALDGLGLVTIGAIVGNPTNPAVISARGQAVPTGAADVAIRALSVRGDVRFAQVLAGFNGFGVPVNADAQIGKVVVAGDWEASSIAAGTVPTNPFFGDADDVRMAGQGVKDRPGVRSAIGSLVIGGQATGTDAAGDHFGIVAELVGLVKVGGVTQPTTAGPGNDDFFVGTTADFGVNEL
jgi:hypothetical protein